MTHPRTYPLGFPGGPIPSSFLTAMDRDISECVDGVGGGTYSGNIILTNLHVSGTSVWNTVGDITCGGLTVIADIVTDGLAWNGATGLWCALDTYLTARTVLADRVVSANVPSQSIDCSTGTAATFNFTLHDTFEVELSDSSAPTTCAIYSTAIVVTDTSGTTELKVKKGAKITITFYANSGQVGGIGLSAAAFPASFRGIDQAAILGPRTGQRTGANGEKDWLKLELENVGTDASPVYTVAITMGAKL